MSGSYEDEKAIRDAISRYCYLIDRDLDADAFAAMFTGDGVWESGPMRIEGAEQLRGLMTHIASSGGKFRHLVANTIIDIKGDDATAESYIHVTNLAGDKIDYFMAAYYDDVLVKRGGKWLFQRRHVRDSVSTMPL